MSSPYGEQIRAHLPTQIQCCFENGSLGFLFYNTGNKEHPPTLNTRNHCDLENYYLKLTPKRGCLDISLFSDALLCQTA